MPRRPTFEDPAQRRRHAVSALDRLVSDLLGPAARRRGFAQSAVLADWGRIVGPALAKRCQPIKLAFAKGAVEGGTLHLRAPSGAALELQHAAPQILERVNDFMGFRAAARLKLVQAPLPRPKAARPTAPEAPDMALEGRIEAGLSGIGDDPLKEALASLGRSVANKNKRP